MRRSAPPFVIVGASVHLDPVGVMAGPLGTGHHTRYRNTQNTAGYSTIEAFLIRSANLPPNFMRTGSVAAMNGALSMSVMTLTPAALTRPCPARRARLAGEV